MHSRSIIGALLRIAAGVFLGGTVLRDQVAGARALAQTVVVGNPSAHPLPVEEQRVDGSGNLDYRPAACDGPRCRLGDFDFSTTIEVPQDDPVELYMQRLRRHPCWLFGRPK
jgi:hypothetical protein